MKVNHSNTGIFRVSKISTDQNLRYPYPVTGVYFAFLKYAATCSPFTSTCSGLTVDGLVGDFSSNGCYIETSQKFNLGTTLVIRLTQ
jgi:hypothetical protein